MNEEKFLKKMIPQLPTNCDVVVGPGDDCAAIKLGVENLQLLAVDQVVSNRHFSLETSPKLVGRKLLARNLSDIAAMGGTPKFCLVTSASDKSFSESFHQDFVEGILELANQFGVVIIGGDISGADSGFLATLTIIGEVKKSEILLRSTAKIGDLICVTGKLGNTFKTQHHLNFSPRILEGQFLARNGFANSCMDISDGLLQDLTRLVNASQCSAKIETKNLPPRTKDLTISEILTDGEDYELLFTVSEKKYKKLLKNWDFECSLSCIGKIIEKNENFAVCDEFDDDLNRKFQVYSHF